MLHASVQREELVAAAEGLAKGGGCKCMCACRWPLHENKDVHVLPQRTWYLLSPLHMDESAGARVPNRIKTVICVRRLHIHVH